MAVKTSELLPLLNQANNPHTYSRHNNHPVYQDPETGKRFVGSWNPPFIAQKETDKTFVVNQTTAYRPDIIAYQFYGTPILSWVICYVNNISNPYDKANGLWPGRLLTIPDITTITSTLTF